MANGAKTKAKVTNLGNSLLDHDAAIARAVGVLVSQKAQLTQLKSDVQADGDYTADDVSDVQATIDAGLAAIASI